MKTSTNNQSRLALLEALLVYARAPIENGEIRVIHQKGTIKNLNTFDKIKEAISNLLGHKNNNYVKDAKEFIKQKFSNLLTNKKTPGIQDLATRSIRKEDTKDSYKYDTLDNNFFDNINSEDWNPKNKTNQPIDQSEKIIKSPAELNIIAKKTRDEFLNSLGNLSVLLKGVLNHPAIEKFVKILLEDQSFEKETQKLITMAYMAREIKNSLGCNSKTAIEYVKKLDLKEKDNDIYSSQLTTRVNHFIQAKKKYHLKSESAINHALLMENDILKNRGLNEKQILDIAHSYFKNTITVNVNKDDLLNKTIENYVQKEFFPEMKNYIKDNNLIEDKTNIELHAIEMTKTAYSNLSTNKKYKAASEFISEKNKNSIDFDENEIRSEIATKIKNEITTDYSEIMINQDDDPNYYDNNQVIGRSDT